MNLRQTLSSAAAITCAAVLALGAPIAASAQRPGGGFGGQPGGGFGGGMMGGRNNDPAQSAAMMLVKRDDVRTELLVTAQQREQLTALETDGNRELGQKMQTFNQTIDFQSFGSLSQDERQAKMQEINQQRQQILQTYQVDLDKRIEKILIGKGTGGVAQMVRLHQLDLQWRGALAVADKTVADAIPLTADQTAKVQVIHQEMQTANMQMMMKMFQEMQAQNQDPGGTPPNPQDFRKAMQKRMEAMKPEMDKTKKAAETKVTALLTPEQQSKWKEMQGKKFTFRTTDNPPA